MKRGNCYVTCEALYHLLGGKKAGWVPMRVRHNGDTHWFLMNEAGPYEFILDPTRKQFRHNDEPAYYAGVGCGFLTKKPSKRARQLMKEMLWQEV